MAKSREKFQRGRRSKLQIKWKETIGKDGGSGGEEFSTFIKVAASKCR
jgi:hypothetical protein